MIYNKQNNNIKKYSINLQQTEGTCQKVAVTFIKSNKKFLYQNTLYSAVFFAKIMFLYWFCIWLFSKVKTLHFIFKCENVLWL